MNKIFLFSIFILLFLVQTVKADQLEWITKEQAEKTVAYIDNNGIKELIMWCACCTDDTKKKVSISKVYYQPAESGDLYEVIVMGTSGKEKVKWIMDLAYVHIKRGSKWRCLAKELGFECDPCTKAFKF